MAVENGLQPGHIAGNQLLAIIITAVTQMNGYEDAGPDVNTNTFTCSLLHFFLLSFSFIH
jgi:hypothetical protein